MSPQPVPWTTDDFIDAGYRFRDCWRSVTRQLNIHPGGLSDIVREVAPEFRLDDQQVSEIRHLPRGQHQIVAGMDARFRHCPITRALESPYAVLLEIFRHGGSFSTEHGIIDIYDAHSTAVAGFVLASKTKARRASE